MPDEPQFNEDALKSQVASAVRETLGEMQQQQQAQRQQQVQQQRVAAAQHQFQSDPVAQTLQPYLAPVVQRAEMQMQAANDKVDFYLGHPEAGGQRADIEKTFQQLMAEGRPMERESIFFYLRGRDPEGYVKSQNEQRQQQLQGVAQQGATVGYAGVPRPDSGQTLSGDHMLTLPLDEQRKVMAGRSF